MVDIIPRSEWRARSPRGATPIDVPTPELWLHHSAGREVGPAGVRSIQRFHMDNLGWTDIAYSFIVDRTDGRIFEGRGDGILGGHTLGRNSVSHGICVMGNFQTGAVSDVAVRAVADLVRHGHRQGWWPDGLSGGHRDVRSTQCPGVNLYNRIDEINRLAAGDGDEEDEMTVKRGDRGTAVTLFQEALKAWNPRALPRFGADGDFGEETEIWVANFQQALDLESRGVIDGVTAALLLEFRPDGA